MIRRFSATSLLVVVLTLPACGVGPFPGGRLDGPERSLAEFNAGLLEEVTIVLLETRPEAPYSVRVQLFKVDGAFYLDPAPERRWLRYIDADPSVRIRFPDEASVYRALARRELSPEVLRRFDSASVVLRLEAESRKNL